MKKTFTSILFIFILSSSYAQTLNTVGLDSLFSILKLKDKFMGNFSISKNGVSIYSRAVGKADIESNKLAAIETKYRIGSISKTFTATLILKAIEEHKLKLNQNISSFFPTIKNGDRITIAQLLSHRSGIHNFTSLLDYMKWNTEKKTKEELIKVIEGGGIDFEPDAKYSYSNSNYVLLSFILEDIYKKNFADILNAKITKPLKLKNTYIGSKIDLSKNESNSYTFDKGWKKVTETDMSIPLGAGAIVSNSQDLNTFITALFDGKIITKEGLASMKTLKDGYGFGLVRFNFDNKTGYGHGGGIDGFTSFLYYFPEDQLSFSLVSNGNSYSNNKILIAALNALHSRKIELPTFEIIHLKSEDLDQYLGIYSADNFPLKITITKRDSTLIVQATGQNAFDMDVLEKDKFEFAKAGLVIQFKPKDKILILNQGGRAFTLTKP